MAKRLTGLMPQVYITQVVYPVLVIIVVSVLACLIPYYAIDNIYVRLLIVCLTYVITYLVMMWIVALEKEHRKLILSKIKKVI